ncbi:PepSY domain-containing protein [Streptomyces sp. NPDC005828]|uniref:PepSY domain-containing protein n=1 Tax=Streptomyces sp. NPDC005828 TaxID=3157071 RepID=UPI0033E4E39F
MKARLLALTGRRRTLAAVLAATVVLGGAGAATAASFADDDDHDDSPAASASHEREDDDDHGDDHDGDADASLVKSVKVDLDTAAGTAVKSVAGTVTGVELDGVDGKPVWKVDIIDAKGAEHEVTVNAVDGKVTADKPGDDRDSGHDAEGHDED